jgi:DNA-binding response OmpR family regulator
LQVSRRQAALREIERDPPDLVLADVVMPQVDGVTLARQLRTRGRTMPVVLLSAVYDDVDVPRVQFMPKPFNLDDILPVITRILGSQKSAPGHGTLT